MLAEKKGTRLKTLAVNPVSDVFRKANVSQTFGDEFFYALYTFISALALTHNMI